MAAPDGSVTRPVIPALTSCAIKGTPPRQTTADTSNSFLFIRTPFLDRISSSIHHPSGSTYHVFRFARGLNRFGDSASARAKRQAKPPAPARGINDLRA